MQQLGHLLTGHSGGSCLDGFFYICMSVGLSALDGHKHLSVCHLPGIYLHSRDFFVFSAHHLQGLCGTNQLFQFHVLIYLLINIYI